MSSNPFNPNFGNVPSLFIDRKEMVDKVASGIRELSEAPYQTTLIYGIRGTGKTAFLNDVCSKFKDDKKWIVIYLTTNGNMLADLTESLIRKTKTSISKTVEALNLSISAYGVGIKTSASDGKQEVSYKNALEELLEKMQQKKMSLLIAVDEVSSDREVREFTSVYNVLKNQNLPVALIMTGLPGNISELQNDKVLTFLLRSFRVDLQPLNLMAVKYCYKKTFEGVGIKIDDVILTKITKMTGGYAYAFQLLGYLIWDAVKDKKIDVHTVENVMDDYRLGLYRNVYAKVYGDLTAVEKEFVKAVAHGEEDDVTIGFITEELGKSKGYISSYRKRLLGEQIITSTGHGLVRFSLPYFKDFILESEALGE